MQFLPRANTSTLERNVMNAYFDDEEDDDKFTHSITDRPDSIEPPPSFVKSVTDTGTLGLIMEKGEVQAALLVGPTKNSSLMETINGMEERRERKDRRGKLIKKGLKEHRITFKDEVLPGETVAQIVLVENYKQFNVDMSTRPSEKCCRML